MCREKGTYLKQGESKGHRVDQGISRHDVLQGGMRFPSVCLQWGRNNDFLPHFSTPIYTEAEERNMKLQLTEKPTVEIRGDNAVIIFPSRPYWFSATREIMDVLDILRDEIEEKIATETIISRLNMPNEEALETLHEVKELLFTNSVLLVDGKLSDSSNVLEPHFQVNVVENVLVVATTQRCNLVCPQCYANARKPLPNEMTTKEIERLVDDLASMPWKNNISRVGLTGGELFTRLDALKIIDYVHSKGFKILISSNGILLTGEIIDQLATYEDLKVSISLDGPNAEVHEFIRGPNTFTPTIVAIGKLAAKGIFVGVNMFVHQGNLELIGETITLASSLGVRAFNCLNMMHVGRANSPRAKRMLVRVSEYSLYQKLFSILQGEPKYQEIMRNSTFANQVMGIAGGVKSHYCGIGTNRALYVRPDGSVYPCPDTALPNFCLGNVRTTSLWEIWDKSSLLMQLRRLDVDTMNPVCAACDVRYFCGGGCRGENYQVTGELRCPHFNCRDIRTAILEIMWMLTEDPAFFQSKVESLYQKTCF